MNTGTITVDLDLDLPRQMAAQFRATADRLDPPVAVTPPAVTHDIDEDLIEDLSILGDKYGPRAVHHAARSLVPHESTLPRSFPADVFADVETVQMVLGQLAGAAGIDDAWGVMVGWFANAIESGRSAGRTWSQSAQNAADDAVDRSYRNGFADGEREGYHKGLSKGQSSQSKAQNALVTELTRQRDEARRVAEEIIAHRGDLPWVTVDPVTDVLAEVTCQTCGRPAHPHPYRHPVVTTLSRADIAMSAAPVPDPIETMADPRYTAGPPAEALPLDAEPARARKEWDRPQFLTDEINLINYRPRTTLLSPESPGWKCGPGCEHAPDGGRHPTVAG